MDVRHQRQGHWHCGRTFVMLTTSGNPADTKKAKDYVTKYLTRPLTKQILMEIPDKYF